MKLCGLVHGGYNCGPPAKRSVSPWSARARLRVGPGLPG